MKLVLTETVRTLRSSSPAILPSDFSLLCPLLRGNSILYPGVHIYYPDHVIILVYECSTPNHEICNGVTAEPGSGFAEALWGSKLVGTHALEKPRNDTTIFDNLDSESLFNNKYLCGILQTAQIPDLLLLLCVVW